MISPRVLEKVVKTSLIRSPRSQTTLKEKGLDRGRQRREAEVNNKDYTYLVDDIPPYFHKEGFRLNPTRPCLPLVIDPSFVLRLSIRHIDIQPGDLLTTLYLN